MKSFFLSILLGIGSLLGFHSSVPQPATSTVSAESVQTNTNTISTSSSSTVATTVSTPSFDTTGWQTYRNSTYSIQLQYPTGWSLSFLSTPNSSNANIVLTNNGYNMTIDMCDVKDCAAAAATTGTGGQYDPNDLLSSSSNVSLNIDGFQSWRTVDPEPNGEDDPTLYFNFTFLKQVPPTSNTSGFNYTSKYTPVSNWINKNGIIYTISYEPNATSTALNYDHSIINQMDEIVQTIIFTHK